VLQGSSNGRALPSTMMSSWFSAARQLIDLADQVDRELTSVDVSRRVADTSPSPLGACPSPRKHSSAWRVHRQHHRHAGPRCRCSPCFRQRCRGACGHRFLRSGPWRCAPAWASAESRSAPGGSLQLRGGNPFSACRSSTFDPGCFPQSLRAEKSRIDRISRQQAAGPCVARLGSISPAARRAHRHARRLNEEGTVWMGRSPTFLP